jgi:hypothetical protein
LSASLRVHDGQASVAKGTLPAACDERTAPVRTTMNHPLHHGLNQVFFGVSPNPGDTAHGICFPFAAFLSM